MGITANLLLGREIAYKVRCTGGVYNHSLDSSNMADNYKVTAVGNHKLPEQQGDLEAELNRLS